MGMSRRSVQYTLQKLIEKKIIVLSNKHVFKRQRTDKANTYIIMIALIWKPKILKLLPETFSQEVKFQPLQKQYILLDTQLKNRQRENILIKDSNKRKRRNFRCWRIRKDESLSVNNINFIDVSSISDDIIRIKKSSPNIETI